MLSNIKAILFDMDGVIFDSERIYYDACFIATKQHNVEVTHEFVSSLAGKSSMVCQLMMQNHLNGDVSLTEKIWEDWGKARYDILKAKGVTLKDGITDLIDYLETTNLSVGLVTSANTNTLKENFSYVEKPKLTNFAPIITVEQVRHPKPNPEPYLLALQKIGTIGNETIVIEDSFSGASAAIESGCKTILLSEDQNLIENDKLLFRADNHTQILNYLKSNGL